MLGPRPDGHHQYYSMAPRWAPYVAGCCWSEDNPHKLLLLETLFNVGSEASLRELTCIIQRNTYSQRYAGHLLLVVTHRRMPSVQRTINMHNTGMTAQRLTQLS